ncbi:unnamed protein product [Chironomus riparius]|uniref:Uncharacterized protein n=1 Tax=Chironomus riparius TaxID=315576 RepID=A0A9N9RMG3_9DIPT|nr:unnamed protein product [Chironomus riparius]
MTFILKLTIITLVLFGFDEAAQLEEGNACIIQYLKNKQRLSQDFPYDTQPDTVKCRLVMPLILKHLETALIQKLSEKEDIKVDCIMAHLKNVSALDYMLMREIIPMSRNLENSEITQKTRNTTKALRRILINGATKCGSDKSYSGLFDDILGLQNMSIAVLQHNYCFSKYAVENKLIEVKHINLNPRRIPTTNLNCEEMIDIQQITKERQLLSKLNDKKLSREEVQCIMDKYRSEKAFDSNVALEVVDFLHISYEEKRANRERIANSLEKYIKSVFTCKKSILELLNHNSQEYVKIMQF